MQPILWGGGIGRKHHLTTGQAVGQGPGGEACGGGEGEDLRFGHVPGEAVGMGDHAVLLPVGADLAFGGEEDREEDPAQVREARAEIG